MLATKGELHASLRRVCRADLFLALWPPFRRRRRPRGRVQQTLLKALGNGCTSSPQLTTDVTGRRPLTPLRPSQLIVEKTNGWSTPSPDPIPEKANPTSDLAQQVDSLALRDDDPSSSLVIVELPTANARKDTNGSTSSSPPPTEPIVFLSSTAAEPPPSSPDDEADPSGCSGAGWSLSSSEPLHSLSFEPPLANTPYSASPFSTPLGVGAAAPFDDGGWGVSPALLVDPRGALFPSSKDATASTFLSHPEQEYHPKLPGELMLLRVVAVPPEFERRDTSSGETGPAWVRSCARGGSRRWSRLGASLRL